MCDVILCFVTVPFDTFELGCKYFLFEEGGICGVCVCVCVFECLIPVLVGASVSLHLRLRGVGGGNRKKERKTTMS